MIELGNLKVGDKFYLPHSPKSILKVVFIDYECKMTHFTFEDSHFLLENFPFDTKVYAVGQ